MISDFHRLAPDYDTFKEYQEQLDGRGTLEDIVEAGERQSLPDEVDVSRAVKKRPLVQTFGDFENAGVTALAMEVLTLDNGAEVYMTHVSTHRDYEEGYVDPEHEDRTMFGYYALCTLKQALDSLNDFHIPVHARLRGYGYLVEGVNGDSLSDIEPTYELEQSLAEAMGASVLAGNGDIHQDNFIVNGDQISCIDLDRSGEQILGRVQYPERPPYPNEDELSPSEFDEAMMEYDRKVGEMLDEGLLDGETLEPKTPDDVGSWEDAMGAGENAFRELKNLTYMEPVNHEHRIKTFMGEALMHKDIESIVDQLPDDHAVDEYRDNFRRNLEGAKNYEFE